VTDTRARPATSGADDGPRHRHLGLALAVIGATQLMVVLDASIVNVALPSIQRALNFSAANLIWVVNGYTLAFGGLLLLGGRTGDLFGRRRMFLAGVLTFTAASFAGGLATTELWLVVARIVQGIGGAVTAPTALALIADTFPEGGPRNRAMGVYAALSGAGAAIGVLLGGALTSGLGWRWVLFVNVPIGLLVAAAIPFVLAETPTRAGRLDLPGAVTSSAGMTALVYGLIHAAASSWTDQWTLAALSVGGALLAAFVALEARSRHALMPLRIFRDRNRSVTYGIILAVGTAIFSMFYFGTLFMQDVLRFGPLTAGLAYLPPSVTIIVVAGVVSRLVGWAGTKIFLASGCALAGAGLFWLSRVHAGSSYTGGLLGPFLLTAAGMGLCFVPLTLSAIAGVPRQEQGIASALLNAGQQLGGTLGLAVLGAIAVVITNHRIADAVRSAGAVLGPSAAHALGARPAGALPAALRQAVTAAAVSGYTTAFAVGGAILVFAFLLATFGLTNVKPESATEGALGAESFLA
jgi:EmrB/QacA subfamily drug resistance transporter